MNDTLLWTLLGHLVCIAQWAAFILVDYAYLGKNKKVRYPCIWAAVLAACVLFVSIRWDLGFFNTASIATNVVYLLLASLLFGGTPNQKLTGSLINGVMCLLTENTVSFLFAWFLGVPTGSVWRYKSCLAALVVSILAVGLLVAYFMRRWNSTCALEPLQAAVMSFFPGVVVALNMGLMVSANRQKPTLMNMVLTVGLTVAVLVHIAIVQMFNDQVVQRQSSRFRAQLEQQRAEALLDSYTAQRRLTHEFTNHMSALSALLNQGDMEGARAYIAGVSKAVAAGTTIMDTHNPLLDSILSKKYEEAAHKGVTVYFDLCDLKRLPFDSTDMVIVISNLMDNAPCSGRSAATGGTCAHPQDPGRIPHLGVQPCATKSGDRGRPPACHHQKGERPWHGPCERAGNPAQIWGRVYGQLPGLLVPLHLFAAGGAFHRQFMTCGPAKYDILSAAAVRFWYNKNSKGRPPCRQWIVAVGREGKPFSCKRALLQDGACRLQCV